MQIGITGVKPYDGRYPLVVGDDMTTVELGWMKRFSGYLPLTVDTGLAGGDAELFCVLAAVALCRAGKITADEVPQVFERLSAVSFARMFTLYADDDEPVEGDDAGPPAGSSNGSESISGTGSRPSSDRSASTIPPGTGTSAWAISQSGPATSET
jgi:hypothetical protein